MTLHEQKLCERTKTEEERKLCEALILLDHPINKRLIDEAYRLLITRMNAGNLDAMIRFLRIGVRQG